MADSFNTPAPRTRCHCTMEYWPSIPRAIPECNSNDLAPIPLIKVEDTLEYINIYDIPRVLDGLISPATIDIDLASDDASSDVCDGPDTNIEDSHASALEDATPPTTPLGESTVNQEDTEAFHYPNPERHTLTQTRELHQSVMRLFDLERQRDCRRRQRRRIKELTRAGRDAEERKKAKESDEVKEFEEAARQREEARRNECREHLAYWRGILREEARREWLECRRTDLSKVSEVGRSQMRDEWPTM